jgi:hypothetical protein
MAYEGFKFKPVAVKDFSPYKNISSAFGGPLDEFFSSSENS